jgi:hypothetical protein
LGHRQAGETKEQGNLEKAILKGLFKSVEADSDSLPAFPGNSRPEGSGASWKIQAAPLFLAAITTVRSAASPAA